jgi:hypothetical protein
MNISRHGRALAAAARGRRLCSIDLVCESPRNSIRKPWSARERRTRPRRGRSRLARNVQRMRNECVTNARTDDSRHTRVYLLSRVDSGVIEGGAHISTPHNQQNPHPIVTRPVRRDVVKHTRQEGPHICTPGRTAWSMDHSAQRALCHKHSNSQYRPLYHSTSSQPELPRVYLR